MKQLFILKVGTTFPALLPELGDFDAWIRQGLGPLPVPVQVLDVEQGYELPPPGRCAGVVVSGSHAMVTDNLPWSLELERWIPSLIGAGVPLLGICYGHQLLARAAGGEVGYHPQGREIGTVAVEPLPAAADDPLFQGLRQPFRAQVTHAQSVLRLPPGAVRLAANDFEANHAFRLGHSAWGVQFHPEYTAAIMRGYLRAQSEALTAAGRDVTALLAAVTETPAAAAVLRNFAGLVDGDASRT